MVKQDKVKTVEEIYKLEKNFEFFIDKNKSMSNNQMKLFKERLQRIRQTIDKENKIIGGIIIDDMKL